jgi:hypothetical protein
MGNVVLLYGGDGTAPLECEIIDGQQRIATFIMLYAALHTELKKEGRTMGLLVKSKNQSEKRWAGGRAGRGGGGAGHMSGSFASKDGCVLRLGVSSVSPIHPTHPHHHTKLQVLLRWQCPAAAAGGQPGLPRQGYGVPHVSRRIFMAVRLVCARSVDWSSCLPFPAATSLIRQATAFSC